RLRTGSTPRIASGSSSAASRHFWTSSGVGGAIGSPPVQPFRPKSSLASKASATSKVPAVMSGSLSERIRLLHSGNTTGDDEHHDPGAGDDPRRKQDVQRCRGSGDPVAHVAASPHGGCQQRGGDDGDPGS